MGTEYPETLYYYAVRDPGSYYPDPRRRISMTRVKEWDLLFLINSYTTHHDGSYFIPDDKGIKQRYYIHHIPEDDFDLLDAFGVPTVYGFEINRWHISQDVLLSKRA